MHSLGAASFVNGTFGRRRGLVIDLPPTCMRVIVLLLLLLPLRVFADQYDKILDAIAKVETGLSPTAVGQQGERTKFQIMPATWAQFSQATQQSASPDEV